MSELANSVLMPHQKTLPSLDDLMKLMAVHGGSDMFVSVGSPVKIKINGSLRSVMTHNITAQDMQ